jgi:hypothetical protein
MVLSIASTRSQIHQAEGRFVRVYRDHRIDASGLTRDRQFRSCFAKVESLEALARLDAPRHVGC